MGACRGAGRYTDAGASQEAPSSVIITTDAPMIPGGRRHHRSHGGDRKSQSAGDTTKEGPANN